MTNCAVGIPAVPVAPRGRGREILPASPQATGRLGWGGLGSPAQAARKRDARRTRGPRRAAARVGVGSRAGARAKQCLAAPAYPAAAR